MKRLLLSLILCNSVVSATILFDPVDCKLEMDFSQETVFQEVRECYIMHICAIIAREYCSGKTLQETLDVVKEYKVEDIDELNELFY